MRIIYFPNLYMWYPLSTIFILKKKLVQHNILLITMYHMSIALHNTPKMSDLDKVLHILPQQDALPSTPNHLRKKHNAS